MATILIELTNQCNLNCRHCFDNRHGGHDEIQLTIVENILSRASYHGFDTMVFTGGEPTLHRYFAQIVRRTCDAGYQFGFVSNGQNFLSIYPSIKPFLDQLQTITFSLDGPTPDSHARLRGNGTFKNLMKALSVCTVREIPFSINSVVTAQNINEIEQLVEITQQLGSSGTRFGCLMLTPAAIDHGLALSPEDIKAVAEKIERLRDNNPYPIAMGPGFYTLDLFPCTPLYLTELTIDLSGRMALCCHLPDHGFSLLHQDLQLDLNRLEFDDALVAWKSAVSEYRSAKKIYFGQHAGEITEHLPCWFCQSYSGQAGWLKGYKNSPWFRFVKENNYLGRL